MNAIEPADTIETRTTGAVGCRCGWASSPPVCFGVPNTRLHDSALRSWPAIRRRRRAWTLGGGSHVCLPLFLALSTTRHHAAFAPRPPAHTASDGCSGRGWTRNCMGWGREFKCPTTSFLAIRYSLFLGGVGTGRICWAASLVCLVRFVPWPLLPSAVL
jgi:hypothetical protein